MSSLLSRVKDIGIPAFGQLFGEMVDELSEYVPDDGVDEIPAEHVLPEQV